MKILRSSLILVPVLWFAACNKSAPDSQTTPSTDTSTTAPDSDAAPNLSAAPTPEILGKLAKADAADGKKDKIVSKCASCSLHMDGSPDHSAKVGDYTLYFCNSCAKKGKPAEAMKVIEGLKVED